MICWTLRTTLLRGLLFQRRQVAKTLFGAVAFAARLAAAAEAPSEPVTNRPAAVISFENRSGQIVLPARLNDSGPWQFLLDTGFAMTMISPQRAEASELTRAGRVEIVGIAGREMAEVYRGARFDFEGLIYSPRRVAALPSERNRTRRRREGTLGSGFFRRFVVEIDSRSKKIGLYEPKEFTYTGAGEVIPLQFEAGTPIVNGLFQRPGHEPVKARLEIDTGCDGGLCLGREFVATNSWLLTAAGAHDSFRQGVGGGARTKEGIIPELDLGKLKIQKPTANFFLDGSPVDDGLAGHLGMDVLRKFKVIFDYSRSRMILE